MKTFSVNRKWTLRAVALLLIGVSTLWAWYATGVPMPLLRGIPMWMTVAGLCSIVYAEFVKD